MKAMIMAFSVYSRIPMPHIEWKEGSMKYSMCFFPFVGAVIGLCSIAVRFLLSAAGCGALLSAACMTALPVVLTGGIHMDGFLDTVDAKNSYQPAEEKLRILKDPHVGAFAVIYGGVYFVLCLGLFSEVDTKAVFLVALGYVYSRVLSGLSVVTLRKAKSDGMLADSAKMAKPAVKWVLVVEGVLCIAAFLLFSPWYGAACAVLGIACFLYYRNMAYRKFGGVTGDLAGYFLQLCELLVLFVAAFMS
ncbi:MAG: adenosylcobinamide-GDP ribazoletransferase [Clostridiaceae bacterium]|nr:adenosylcobinamide-GDP ribazoletransferase [Clostridiaceae bacterium]